MTEPLPDKLTIGEKYNPAMEMTDPDQAADYFERCVEHTMRLAGKTRAEAEDIERSNLGYYAGYYSNEVRVRVERLFRCKHPIFGAIAEHGAPTVEDALAAGMKAAGKG